MRSADCVEFTCVLAIYSSPLYCTCLWLYDRLATHLLGPPVIDAKAGAVSRSFRYMLSLPHEVDGHAAVDLIL